MMTTATETTACRASSCTVRADVRPMLTYKCLLCGTDSGTADQSKFTNWYIAHRALTCRGRRPNAQGDSLPPGKEPNGH